MTTAPVASPAMPRDDVHGAGAAMHLQLSAAAMFADADEDVHLAPMPPTAAALRRHDSPTRAEHRRVRGRDAPRRVPHLSSAHRVLGRTACLTCCQERLESQVRHVDETYGSRPAPVSAASVDATGEPIKKVYASEVVVVNALSDDDLSDVRVHPLGRRRVPSRALSSRCTAPSPRCCRPPSCRRTRRSASCATLILIRKTARKARIRARTGVVGRRENARTIGRC